MEGKESMIQKEETWNERGKEEGKRRN